MAEPPESAPVRRGGEPVAGPTPGPWAYNPDFDEVQTEDGARTLAKLGAGADDRRFAAEAQANGRLMAAAPALVEALTALFHATADLLDHVTGMADTEPTPIFEGAERALSEAAAAMDVAGAPGPSDADVWGGGRAPEEDA